MPTPRKYPNDAARVAAYRARHELVTFSVDIPKQLVTELEAYLRFKNMTKAAVVEKLIRSQLLRKR